MLTHYCLFISAMLLKMYLVQCVWYIIYTIDYAARWHIIIITSLFIAFYTKFTAAVARFEWFAETARVQQILVLYCSCGILPCVLIYNIIMVLPRFISDCGYNNMVNIIVVVVYCGGTENNMVEGERKILSIRSFRDWTAKRTQSQRNGSCWTKKRG